MFRLSVVLNFISVLLLRCTLVSFFTFFVGTISIHNLIYKLNNINNMKDIMNFTLGWIGAILGSDSACNETEMIMFKTLQ